MAEWDDGRAGRFDSGMMRLFPPSYPPTLSLSDRPKCCIPVQNFSQHHAVVAQLRREDLDG